MLKLILKLERLSMKLSEAIKTIIILNLCAIPVPLIDFYKHGITLGFFSYIFHVCSAIIGFSIACYFCQTKEMKCKRIPIRKMWKERKWMRINLHGSEK